MRVDILIGVCFTALMVVIAINEIQDSKLSEKRIENHICRYENRKMTVDYDCNNVKALKEILNESN